MATTQRAQSQNVDLFGNSTLTPRQLMQQQLGQIMQDTAAQTASADPRTQGVSMMGAAAGGLLQKLLIDKGLMEKPPEMVRAEGLAKARDDARQIAADQGVSLENDPSKFADIAISTIMRHNYPGAEADAARVLVWKQTKEAQQRAADLERAQTDALKAKELESLSKYTPESVQKYKQSGNYADLVLDPSQTGKGRGEYYVPIDTADGVKAFDARSGQIVDPATHQPIGKPVVKSSSDPNLQSNLGFAKTSGEEGSKNLFTQRQAAVDATNSLVGIGQARKLLDEGMKTGKFANFEVGLGTTLQAMGITFKDDAIENAQAFAAAQAKQVASIIKAFGSGTGLSDADREFATKAAGGDITMNEKSIRKILDINERAALNVIKNYKDLYGRVKKDYLPYSMELPEVPGSSKPAESASTKPSIDDLLKKYGGKSK